MQPMSYYMAVKYVPMTTAVVSARAGVMKRQGCTWPLDERKESVHRDLSVRRRLMMRGNLHPNGYA